MKKKINIALIIVVLGLWGTVFYKTINQYFFSKEPVNNIFINKTLKINSLTKDTFHLAKLSRDPFLNIQYQPIKPALRIKSTKPKVIVAVKPVEVKYWPTIAYYGFIKSKEKEKELILVKINSKLYKLRKDDLIEEITIKKIYKDSIEVVFNKEKKIIRLN